MTGHKQFLLGLFFLLTFGLLGYFTLFQSDLSLFGYSEELAVYFPRANGLRKGDSVQVAGVRWGKVSGIQFDPEATPARRVVVTIELDQPLPLRGNYEILIESATLLGGRVLTIDPGTVNQPLIGTGGLLTGKVAEDPLDALGNLVRRNEAAVTDAIEGLREIIDGVRSGKGVIGGLFQDEQLRADVSRGVSAAADTFENVDKVAKGLADGEGVIGRLLRDDELQAQMERIVANIEQVTEDVQVLSGDARAGRGLVGRILTDDGVARDFSEGLADLRQIIGRVNRGEGTLGRIVTGDEIGKNLDEVIRRLAEGEGTLGRLFASDEVYDDLRRIGDDVAEIVATVREGRGTVGKLVMDEELYDQLRLAVGLITRSLEEFREAAPISTMTGVIFGAF